MTKCQLKWLLTFSKQLYLSKLKLKIKLQTFFQFIVFTWLLNIFPQNNKTVVCLTSSFFDEECKLPWDPQDSLSCIHSR